MSTAPTDPPNFESDSYDIVTNQIFCLSCKSLTNVYAFALPDGTMPYFIRRLSQNAIEQVRQFTNKYYLDKHPRRQESFWMNHCEWCGAQISEKDIFEESQLGEGPFGPEPYEGELQLQAQEFQEPFQAWADAKLDDWGPEPDEEEGNS